MNLLKTCLKCYLQYMHLVAVITWQFSCGRSKVKFYDKVESAEEYQDLFKRYGQHHEITDDFVSKTEQFI